MELRFIEKNHVYQSRPEIKWTSVTRIVEKYTTPFQEVLMSERCSEDPTSKWYNLPPWRIRELWEIENKRSRDCGHWFHDIMEKKALLRGGKEYKGHQLKVIPSIIKNGYKLAPEQKLSSGIYPEHFMYNEQAGICGQSDLVYVYGDTVDIEDYKTNKKIDTKGYQFKNGSIKMMQSIMSDIPDCNYFHYALQLSIYMKLVLLKNPGLKPGKIRIMHVEFDVECRDEYGFPVLKRNDHNGYIVASTKWYKLPYLEDKVNQIFGLTN